jgi:hypothetical protein
MRLLHVRPASAGARGLTIPEVVLTLVLFLLLSGSAILAARGGYGAFVETNRNNDIEVRVRRTIDKVAFELMSAGDSQLLPNPTGQFGTSNLAFAQAKSYDAVADETDWGPSMRLALELSPGEADDGADDDADGLVDEGRLVLTRDEGGPGERRVVLCDNVRELLEGEIANGADDNGNGVVDEAGFNVHRLGDVLYVRLSLEESAEPADPIVRTLETSLRLRN